MAKKFAICRVQKRHDLKQVGRSEGHNLRAFQTAHADPDAAPPRILFGSKGLTTQLREVLPAKRRKDAVLAFEVLLAASPDWFELQSPQQVEAWAEANIAWLKERFGKNLMQVVLHTDEQTPHIHAYCHPVHDDGSLSYFKMLGTPKLMSELQTDYALAMKPLGLRRGLRKSSATHEETGRWRARQKQEPTLNLPPITAADIPPATLADRLNPEGYVKTVLEAFLRKLKRQLAKTLKEAGENLKARKLNEELHAKAGELEARQEAESTRAEIYRKMLAGLIGFEPDIDTLAGQTAILDAVKKARRQLGRGKRVETQETAEKAPEKAPEQAQGAQATTRERPRAPRPGRGPGLQR